MGKKEVKEQEPELKVEEPVEEEVKETDRVAELEAEVNSLKEENASLKDQMIRRQAETDNFRKRILRDKEEAVLYANSKLIEDLLQFLDNLDRAIVSADKTQDIKALINGLEMSQNQLYTELDKNWGLKAIDTVGKEFNPLEHEACMMTVDENLEVETVLEEFLKGYKLHERVIRPAKVKIGKPSI